MNIYQYLQRAISEPLPGVLLFYGPERHFRKQVVDLIVDRLIPPAVRAINLMRLPAGAGWADLMKALRQPGFGNRLIVAPLPKEGKGEEFQKYLEQPSPRITLILLADDEPKGGVARALGLTGEVVHCPAPSRANMPSIVRFALKEARLAATDEAAAYLARFLEPDTSLVVDVAQRLAYYAEGSGLVEADLNAARAICPHSSQASVWALAEASNPAAALALWHELIEQGEDPMRLLALLHRHYQLLLEAPAAKAAHGSAAAQVMGEHPVGVQKALSASGRKPATDWARALELVAQAQGDLRGGRTVLAALPTVIARLPFASR